MTVIREPLDIAAAAQLACLLEVSAPKPGNVSAQNAFADVAYEHFLASAAAIGRPLGAAADVALGRTIHRCVQATREWTRSNTNLGIVLLFTPLARAASRVATRASVDRDELRTTVAETLANTTVDDAREAYAAIRLASPGGLGTSNDQDVALEPTVPLREAMRIAADRDDIAREYVTDYQTTFEVAAPTLELALHAGLPWSDAIVETFLTTLAARPDTHIARRGGPLLAASVSDQARLVLAEGGVRSVHGRHAIARLDATLRGDGNLANPGTTADLTAAAIFVVLLGGGWHSRSGGIHGASR